MSAPDPGAAIVASLDEEAVRALADRLRPYLHGSDDRPLLTPAQVAERLRLRPKTVARMARDGRLPAVKVGAGRRFRPDQLDIAPRMRSSAPGTLAMWPRRKNQLAAPTLSLALRSATRSRSPRLSSTLGGGRCRSGWSWR